MDIEFPRLNDALFQEEEFNKNSSDTAVGKGLQGNSTITGGIDKTYDKNGMLNDSQPWSDAD